MRQRMHPVQKKNIGDGVGYKGLQYLCIQQAVMQHPSVPLHTTSGHRQHCLQGGQQSSRGGGMSADTEASAIPFRSRNHATN